MTLPQKVELVDAVTGVSVFVHNGKYELEEIPNPRGFPGPMAQWLVLFGTRVGAARGYWSAVLNNGEMIEA
ncbi:hypothetical protein KKC49_04000 [Patescibacteria group bacterium]|nr:hypothetical protein [Patescibacteria group bacterium]MBU4461540.1 hypothetical protein [Patescibacteria group bacterium]